MRNGTWTLRLADKVAKLLTTLTVEKLGNPFEPHYTFDNILRAYIAFVISPHFGNKWQIYFNYLFYAEILKPNQGWGQAHIILTITS